MLCCPITSRVKGYPFEVALDAGGVRGVVLSDQIKRLDWRARRAKRKGAVPKAVMEQTLARIRALLRRGTGTTISIALHSLISF
jgi:mRNA interferase MazF